MKISVVIPICNEQEYIKNCLLSLKNQSVKADEIIVVDNNSSDKTSFIARKCGVRIIQEKKQGITYARNKGFNMAKYEIIARCDGDTIVPIDWIERIKYNFSHYQIDALTGPYQFYDLFIKFHLYADIIFYLNRFFLKGNAVLNGSNLAISKKIWQKVKNSLCLNDQKVHEDMDLTIHILEKGGTTRRDKSLIVETSARRMFKNPISAFGEYSLRGIRTLYLHKNLLRKL